MENCSMVVNCSNALSSEVNVENSLLVLAYAAPAYWATFCLGIIGMVNNSLLLFMFYHLKWYSENSIFLFWNLAIVDFLCCITTTIAVTYALYYHVAEQPNIEKAYVCEGLYFWPTVLNNVSDRMALAIAIDRLMVKWCPMNWPYHYGPKFRLCAVIVSWFWAMVQPVLQVILITPYDECILACIAFSQANPNAQSHWFNHLVVAVNHTINGLIVIIYVVIPIGASIRIRMCLHQVSTNGTRILGTGKVLHDKVPTFLADVRRLSFVYLLCFLGSELSAVIVCDTISSLLSKNLKSSAIEQSICNLFIQLNAVYHLYIWLLNEKFRKGLFAILFCSRNVVPDK